MGSDRARALCLRPASSGPRTGAVLQALTVPILLTFALLAGCGLGGPSGIDLISIPEGFEIEVAAGPPLVERPMIVDLDDEGRLYVAESSGSNDDVRKQLVDRPHSILRLEDLDGDGRYDRRTVFADKMMFPEGVLWHDGSVYVSAPPSIWKLTDTDDDGVADLREEWFDAKTLTNCANDLHGPYLGLDGWIYWTKGAFAEQTYERPGREPLVTRAAHVFRRRASGGLVEPVLTGGMDNPVEVAFTPEGERLLTSTFLIHPQVGKRDGILHAVYGGVYGKAHGVTDSHPMTGGYLSIMTHLGGAAPVGLARFESMGFGEEYRGRLFATSFNLRKVTSHKLVPKAATFETEDSEFLVSESRDFHPTDVMEDADGSLLVVDTGGWYKLCCPTSQLMKADVLGAIYRIRRKGVIPPTDPLGSRLDWPDMVPEDLIALLDDDRPAVRKRAIASLARMNSVSALRSAITGSDSETIRRNAVWALTRIETAGARESVRTALNDQSGSVRQAALHSTALHRDAPAVARALEMLGDPSDAIKRVAAEALGRIGDPAAVGALLRAAASAEGEVLTHSLTYALIEIADPRATLAGLSAGSVRTRRAAMIALDQMSPPSLRPTDVLPRLQSSEPSISEAARWVAGRHPEWGGHLSGHLSRRLASAREQDRAELSSDLASFAGTTDVQVLLARTASGNGSAVARTIALDAMTAAPLRDAPTEWADAIAAALQRHDTLEPALAAAQSLPLPEEERDPALDSALVSVARDAALVPSIRVRALDAAREGLEALDPALFDLAASQVLPSEDVETRGAAARVLSGAALDDGQLLELAGLLPSVGPMELPRLVVAFGQSDNPEVGARMAEGLSESKAIANLRADIVEAAAGNFPVEVRQALDSLLAGEVAGLGQQGARLENMLASLGVGDIVRGQAVFNSTETACLACHSIGYQGGKVGPDLTRIGQIRTRRDLLEAIVYPSASFVRSYEPVIAVTADASVNGVPLEETETHLLLAVDAEEQVRLLRSEIEEIRPGTVSVMPSGLDDQLGRDELADLLAFLEATQWGPPGSGR